jgi:hypothetical protein
MATIAPHGLSRRNDRLFYSTVLLAAAAVTVWGFARSYYLSRFFAPPPGAPPFTALLAVHGAVFTAWVALTLVQPALIAARQVQVHRRLGWLGAGLAAAVVLFGNLAAIAAMDGGFIGLGDPRAFYAVPFFSINSFAVAIALAILWRNRPETHKRLILLSVVGIIGAPIARIPLDIVQAGAPFTFIFLPNLVTLAGILYDWRSRGRVHPVWIWGGAAMVATQIVMMAVMGTDAWIGFAEAMRGLW